MPVLLNLNSVPPTIQQATKPGYTSFLLELGREMKNEDFEIFKFALRNDIPARTMEGLRQPHQVFSELETRGLLGPDKLDVLRGHFEEIDRPKLIKLVDEFDDAGTKFPLKPRSDNRLEKDGYIVSVKGGRHFNTSEGEFVEVRSGSNYSLTLTNNNNNRCEINIQIDGHEMFPNGFLFRPKRTFTIERPSSIKEKFKFYAIRDAPNGSGINKWRKDENGLIQVKFTPERADMKITCVAPGLESQTIFCSTEVTDDNFLDMVSRVFDNAVVTVMINSWKPLGKRGVKLTEYGVRDGSRVNVNVGGVGGVSASSIVKKATTTKKDFILGATTLEGESDQTFGSGKGFPIDPSEAVTLNLRLVARENEIPLPPTGSPTPLTKATLIPPPVPI